MINTKLFHRHKTAIETRQKLLAKIRINLERHHIKQNKSFNNMITNIKKEINEFPETFRKTKYKERMLKRIFSIHRTETDKLWGRFKSKRFLELAKPKYKPINRFFHFSGQKIVVVDE